MSTIKMLDDRILKLKDEQRMITAQYDNMAEQMRRHSTRYAQLTGAINELEDLKKSINGSEPE
jgi:hypothetical protein